LNSQGTDTVSNNKSSNNSSGGSSKQQPAANPPTVAVVAGKCKGVAPIAAIRASGMQL